MFRWVVIVGIAGASVIALTLLTRPLIGAIWFFILLVAAAWHGWRWVARKQRES